MTGRRNDGVLRIDPKSLRVSDFVDENGRTKEYLVLADAGGVSMTPAGTSSLDVPMIHMRRELRSVQLAGPFGKKADAAKAVLALRAAMGGGAK